MLSSFEMYWDDNECWINGSCQITVDEYREYFILQGYNFEVLGKYILNKLEKLGLSEDIVYSPYINWTTVEKYMGNNHYYVSFEAQLSPNYQAE